MNRLDDPRYDMIYLNPEDDVGSSNSQIGASYCILPAQSTVVESKIDETDIASNLEQEFSQIQEIGIGLQRSDGPFCETSDKSSETVEIDVGHTVLDNSDPPLEGPFKKDDGFYHCRFCNNRKSTIKKEMVRHESMHLGPSYDCPFESCGKKFMRKEHVKRHYVIHTGETPYQCEVCDKRFKRKDHLLIHFRGHKPKQLQCRYCIHTFLDEQSLATHEEIIHGNKSTVVKIEVEIENETPNSNQIPEHTSNVEIDGDGMDTSFSEKDKSYSCRYCNYSSTHRSHLESHERTHTVVEMCGGSDTNCVEGVLIKECYVMCERLKIDEEKEEEEEAEEVDEGGGGGGGGDGGGDDPTDQIEIDINKYLVFDKSLKSIPQEELYTCKHCDKEFNRKDSLLRHTKYVHLGEPRQECKICDRKFVRRDHLKNHLMTHLRRVKKEKLTNGLVKDKEKLCVEEKTIRSELDRFLKKRRKSVEPFGDIVILGKYNRSQVVFTCRFCEEFRCDTKIELAAHKKAHHGTKPYQCTHCGSSFSRQHHLSRHTILHTGVKPYDCHICSRSFHRKDHLDKHMLVHNGEKPYKCPVCPKAFSRPYLMRNHEKKHTESQITQL